MIRNYCVVVKIDVGVRGAHPNLRASHLKGESRVRFENDKEDEREFDVVSDKFVGQAKGSNVKVNPKFRRQAKATFEAASQNNKKVYYHFQGGEPNSGVVKKLKEYSKRYDVEVIIDTNPLKF